MKKTIALVLAVVLAFSLCACGSSGNNAGTSAAADKYDTFAAQYGTIDGLYRDVTIATRMDVPNLTPTSGTIVPKDMFYSNVYETLFDFDADENLYPSLAKGFEAAADGSYWDIFLYETIKDSEGNDITAEDVASSFDWLVGAGEALKYEDVKSWEVVDTYTFRINWNHAPASPDDYEFPLVRTYIFDSKYVGSDFATMPVATGNYIVADYLTGNHVTLWANPNYWAMTTSEDVTGRMSLHDAHVQMITFEIIGESATAEVALEEGTIDFCNYITQQASIEKFKTKYADKYVVDDTHVANTYFFLEPNMDSSSILGNDENLRLAIYYGLSNDAISQLMGSSYIPMKSLGHRGFGDFNIEWENEENYCTVYDVDRAKEYLAKSGYNGEDLNIVCKTSEIEKNAAQSILGQLTMLGIKCHMTSIDNAIFTGETADPSNWDMILFEMGGTSLAGSLTLPLGNPNTNEDGSDSWSLNFIRDQKLVDLLNVAKADETHNDENMKALIDYAFENSYIYPIAYSFTCYIYNKDITDLYIRETAVTPAASTYAGQTFEPEKGIKIAIGAAFDPALAGSYTFSEPGEFGNKDNDYVLTLNADGTYRLDCDNCVGEKIWTEGTVTLVGDRTVALSASPVKGDMDKLLNSGWADADNPAPVFILGTDGTMKPAVSGDISTVAGSYTFSEPGEFGNKDNDYVLTINADGTYRLDCDNCVGEKIWTEGTATLNADGSVSLSASPVKGDMDKLLNSGWADADNPAPTFVLNPDGTMAPAGMASAEPTDKPAGNGEEPGILGGLAGMGFDRFDWTEATPFGNIPWHLMIKAGADKSAAGNETGEYCLVVENPNLGTQDGLLVYHGTYENDKGVFNLSEPTEPDSEMKRLGNMWNSDGTSAWQISGPGETTPVEAGATPAAAAPADKPAGNGEEPGILGGLAGMGFDRFDWTEAAPVGDVPWHLFIKAGPDKDANGNETGEYVLVVENPNLGTKDGLLVYHGTYVNDKGTFLLSEPTEPDSEMKRLGNMWNADGTSTWKISGPGATTPVEVTK